MIQYAGRTHPGHKRSHNEDCYSADVDLGLWLVADGVGGHLNGEVAAAITCETVARDVGRGADLLQAIANAHEAILEEIHSRGGENNMGSTLVALRMQDRKFEIAWVGDSRAYLFDGELKQLTRDHSPVGEMVARGSITPEQAQRHPKRHVLSQSLGISDAVSIQPERITGELRPGQQLLLCTDGLTDELNDRRLAAEMAAHDSVEAQVQALLTAALDAGGADNTTVVVVGEPGAKKSGGRNSADLEVTRDIGEAVRGQASARRRSHNGKVLLIVALIVALAVFWLTR